MIPIIEFVLGIAVLVYSAEKLIGNLVGIASRWAISLFLVAVVFTGIEFDDLAFGIVLNLEDLSNVALGTVIGTTVAMTGVVLAVAAIVAPTPVDVPTSYLVLFVAAPVVMYALALVGALTLLTGISLIAAFVAFVGWVAYREHSARRPVWRNAELYEQIDNLKVGAGSKGGTATATPTGEDGDAPTAATSAGSASRSADGRPGFDLPPDLKVDQGFLKARQHSPGATIALAVLALIGLVAGALIAGQGTEGILDEFAIDSTVFGVTIATLALSVEDIFLTAEPQRRGAPEIAVANVIGSVVFSVTGKLGIILLVGGAIIVDHSVLVWHLPALIVITLISALFLSTGRLLRWHGIVLLGLYVIYFVTSLVSFGGVPSTTELAHDIATPERAIPVMTQDRIEAGLAAVAAIVGLVLVFGYRDASGADSGDEGAGPTGPATTSHVAPGPAPGGQVPPLPGQFQQPAEFQQDDDG